MGIILKYYHYSVEPQITLNKKLFRFKKIVRSKKLSKKSEKRGAKQIYIKQWIQFSAKIKKP